ncbi:MAG: hypothetical protein BM557_10475 [Flavobacterium sp. MedPE-SWcel]|nr:MAG: hypothetical protein BM557_10475 [Flavobacterium sp. MedPE-SWcel]
MLTNCKKQHEAPKEKYCGIEVTGFEIMDLKTIANKGYTYTDEDKALAGDMMRAVEEIPNNSYKAKFSFFMKDENTIGMYIIGPDDQAAVEKISCLLLQEDFDGRLPENRKLLFYTDDHANLVAAIKSKTE